MQRLMSIGFLNFEFNSHKPFRSFVAPIAAICQSTKAHSDPNRKTQSMLPVPERRRGWGIRTRQTRGSGLGPDHQVCHRMRPAPLQGLRMLLRIPGIRWTRRRNRYVSGSDKLQSLLTDSDAYNMHPYFFHHRWNHLLLLMSIKCLVRTKLLCLTLIRMFSSHNSECKELLS